MKHIPSLLRWQCVHIYSGSFFRVLRWVHVDSTNSMILERISGDMSMRQSDGRQYTLLQLL